MDALNYVGDVLTVAVFDADLFDDLFDGMVQHGRRVSHKTTIAHGSSMLGRAELALGNRDEAFAHMTEALRIHIEIGDGFGVQLDLEGFLRSEAVFDSLVDARSANAVFICGRGPMMDAAEAALLARGVAREKILIERLTSSVLSA